MKRTLIIFGIIVLIIASIIVGIILLYPTYRQKKDMRIVVSLEAKAIPIVLQNDVKFFSDKEKCKRIKYGVIEAASPQGCAYIKNITDESKKLIPDFSGSDQALFNRIKDALREIPSEKFNELRPEYQSAFSKVEIGIGFHIACSFCRVRYIYWPEYQSLPPDVKGDIYYTSINENWYRVDED